jgi:P27 family predicted phage terminase small subunit
MGGNLRGGPKIKPVILKMMEGNPGKRRLPVNEPIPEDKSKPMPPKQLDAYALEEWDRVCDGLHGMGILYSIDMAILAAYCVAYSRWRRAEEELIKEEKVRNIDSLLKEIPSTGRVMPHPLVTVASEASKDMIRYAAHLGMTPSARAGLGVDPRKLGKDSKFSGLIEKNVKHG